MLFRCVQLPATEQLCAIEKLDASAQAMAGRGGGAAVGHVFQLGEEAEILNIATCPSTGRLRALTQYGWTDLDKGVSEGETGGRVQDLASPLYFEPIEEMRMKAVSEFKHQGNAAFRAGQYSKSAMLYTIAVVRTFMRISTWYPPEHTRIP